MASRSVTIAPPSLAERSTDAFRVGDARGSIGDFSTRFAMLLADAASGAAAAPASDLDASELRLETVEEALDLAGAALQPAEPAEPAEPAQQHPAASNGNGGGRTSSSGGQAEEDDSTVDPAPSPTLPAPREYAATQREKFRAMTTVQSEVADVMEKKEAEHKEAVRALHSMRALGPEGVSSRLAAPKRSFTELATTPAIFSSLDVKHRAQQEQDQPQPPSTGAASTEFPAAPDALVPGGEVVIHVAVHLPQMPACVSEEWLVLGSQQLTELRDAVFCLAEVNLRNAEREENLRRPADQKLTLTSPAAYIYIEGTFYVDDRSPDAVDYSELIRGYLEEHGMKAPLHPQPVPAAAPLSPDFTDDFTVASMHNTRFEDVWLRLGRASPGLFCHQGGCEHLLVFKDVRAHDPAADPPLLRHYPAKVADPGTGIAMRRQCEACGLRPAKKVTHEDRCAPQTPFFWCSDCFSMMHYDEGGRAVYMDFRVFPYQGEYMAKQLKRRW